MKISVFQGHSAKRAAIEFSISLCYEKFFVNLLLSGIVEYFDSLFYC